MKADEQLAGQSAHQPHPSFVWGGSNIVKPIIGCPVPLAYQQRRGRNWALVAEIEPSVLSDGHLDESKVFTPMHRPPCYFHHKDGLAARRGGQPRLGDSEHLQAAALSQTASSRCSWAFLTAIFKPTGRHRWQALCKRLAPLGAYGARSGLLARQARCNTAAGSWPRDGFSLARWPMVEFGTGRFV